jgi:DNA modification methylase
MTTRHSVEHANALEFLRGLPPDSIDALVTDPPSGIEFMGNDWDSDKGGRDEWIAWLAEIMREALRVLKPGAHGFVWAIPKTSHRTGMALDLAGFEIRDTLHHLYGTGMPHALNVSKAIDKKLGTSANRVDIHSYVAGGNAGTSTKEKGGTYGVRAKNSPPVKLTVQTGGCDESRKWDGWHSELKPAVEHWILVRKPFKGTIAENVLKHGVGALNIDGCRVVTDWASRPASWHRSGHSAKPGAEKIAAPPGIGIQCHPQGRFPANLALSHAHECDNEQCAENCPIAQLESDAQFFNCFLYQKKPSSKEKDAGVTGENRHPTVKPIALMQHLVRMVTPVDGVVLDPFVGSGTTAVAAVLEGRRFIGCELHDDDERPYVSTARARVAHALLESKHIQQQLPLKTAKEQP